MAILESNWLTKSWHFRARAAVSSVCSFQVDSVVAAEYELEYLLLEGHCYDITTGQPPRGLQFTLGTSTSPVIVDTIVMANLVRSCWSWNSQMLFLQRAQHCQQPLRVPSRGLWVWGEPCTPQLLANASEPPHSSHWWLKPLSGSHLFREALLSLQLAEIFWNIFNCCQYS